jgi:uncharacterized protein
VTDSSDLTGVVVVGAGTAAAPPDVVRINLAAEATADEVQAALVEATNALSRMRSVLADSGIPPGDLRTTDMNVRVDQGPPRRYVAHLGLSAMMRDLGAAGTIVQNALAEAGDAARLSGLLFAHSDPSSLLETARAGAFADALEKARQYAALARRELGVVVSVDDTGPGGPIPLPRRMAAMPLADLGMEGGLQEVSASVVVHWSWA